MKPPWYAIFLISAAIGFMLGNAAAPKKIEYRDAKLPLITIATVDKCAYLIYKDCIIHRADCTNHSTITAYYDLATNTNTTFNLHSR